MRDGPVCMGRGVRTKREWGCDSWDDLGLRDRVGRSRGENRVFLRRRGEGKYTKAEWGEKVIQSGRGYTGRSGAGQGCNVLRFRVCGGGGKGARRGDKPFPLLSNVNSSRQT